MVKIINFEKEKIEEKRKQIEEEMQTNNKDVRKHNTIVWVIYLFVITVINAGLFCAVKYINFDAVFAVFISFISFFVGMFIAIHSVEEEWCWSDYKQTAFKYERITEGKNILDAKVLYKNGSYVKLTLEDPNTHEVTEEDIYGWDEKVRTDIGEIIVNVINETIYIPYKVEPRI